jgi:hypothetical protein
MVVNTANDEAIARAVAQSEQVASGTAQLIALQSLFASCVAF